MSVNEILELISEEMEKETRSDGSLTDFGRGMLIIKTKIEEHCEDCSLNEVVSK